MIVKRIGAMSLGRITGLIGFVGGLLVAFLYNLVAQRMGGVQLDVE